MDVSSRPRAPMPRGYSRRPFVACVDDEPEVLHAYGRLLRDEPYELLAFRDPARVLAWSLVNPVEVLLADERMPQMSGTELLGEVGRRSPRTRLALVTAYPDPAVVARETPVPIRRILTKPVGAEDLKAAIRRLLREVPEEGTLGADPRGAGRIELVPGKADRPGLEATIDLAGASREAVLDQLIPIAIWSHSSGEPPIVTLRNLHAFTAPLPALLEDLDRTLGRLDARLL